MITFLNDADEDEDGVDDKGVLGLRKGQSGVLKWGKDKFCSF